MACFARWWQDNSTPLHLDQEVWLQAGERGEEMVEDLFRRGAKFPAACADFHPALLVAVVALRPRLPAQQDEVGVVGEFHDGWKGSRPHKRQKINRGLRG